MPTSKQVDPENKKARKIKSVGVSAKEGAKSNLGNVESKRRRRRASSSSSSCSESSSGTGSSSSSSSGSTSSSNESEVEKKKLNSKHDGRVKQHRNPQASGDDKHNPAKKGCDIRKVESVENNGDSTEKKPCVKKQLADEVVDVHLKQEKHSPSPLPHEVSGKNGEEEGKISRSPERQTYIKDERERRSRSRSPAGGEIRARYSSPGRRKVSPDAPKPTKVHIGSLTRNVTQEHLREIFANFGSIRSAELQMDIRRPWLSRCSGYVDYEDHTSAKDAVEKMNGGQIDGQEVVVNTVLIPQRRPDRVAGRRPPSPRRRVRSPPRRRRASPYRRRSPPRSNFRRRSRSPAPRGRRSRSRSHSRRRSSPLPRKKSPVANKRYRRYSGSSGSSSSSSA